MTIPVSLRDPANRTDIQGNTFAPCAPHRHICCVCVSSSGSEQNHDALGMLGLSLLKGMDLTKRVLPELSQPHWQNIQQIELKLSLLTAQRTDKQLLLHTGGPPIKCSRLASITFRGTFGKSAQTGGCPGRLLCAQHAQKV